MTTEIFYEEESKFDDMFEAIFYNENDDLRIFLDNGADPNSVNEHYESALSCAIYQNNMEGARMLLDYGAELRYNPYILKTAVLHGDQDIVEFLLQNGADSDPEPDANGNNLLHTAILHSENPGIISLLLSYGTEYRLENSDGFTPYDLAMHTDQLEMAVMF